MLHFTPWTPGTEQASCRTCRYAVGLPWPALWCTLLESVRVYPCGRWEREPGADPPERDAG